jgi:hypothetical protein
MATRERRLEAFTTAGEPEEGLRAQLLCEDHVGTYTTTFVCIWREGEWVNEKTNDKIVCLVVGWREVMQRPCLASWDQGKASNDPGAVHLSGLRGFPSYKNS